MSAIANLPTVAGASAPGRVGDRINEAAAAGGSRDTVAVPGGDAAPSGFGHVQPAAQPHAWGSWVVVDGAGTEQELVERVCDSCRDAELAAADCLGVRLVAVQPCPASFAVGVAA